MAGVAVADLAVGGIEDAAAGVAGFDAINADDMLEDGLEAPEAAPAQRGDLVHFLRLHERVLQRARLATASLRVVQPPGNPIIGVKVCPTPSWWKTSACRRKLT